MRIRLLLVVFISMISLEFAFSREIISLSDYGIVPDTKEDIIPLLQKVSRDIKGRKVELRFEPGRYDFYSPSKGLTQTSAIFPLTFEGLDSLYVNAVGAEFVGHGQLTPFYFKDCTNLVVEGFSFDWSRPLVSQGTIVGMCDEYVDIQFDRQRYPFRQVGDKVLFYGENWEADVCERSYSTLHDPKSGEILQGTKDMFLSQQNALFRGKSTIVGSDTVRFYGKPDTYFAPLGSIIVLYHGVYLGFITMIQDCKNVVLKDLTIHHSCGVAIHPLFVDGIVLDNVNFTPSEGRVFTAVADATHFSNCRGVIEVKNCSFDGQGDDALNVHGRYYKLEAQPITNKFISLSTTRGFQDVPKVGDQMWIIDSATLSRIGIAKVSEVRGNALWAKVRFSELEMWQEGSSDYYVENASWYPSLKVHNCLFGKSNRARGILITTPGKAEVFDNHFRSAGTAILIEGDLTHWYESGSIADLDIHDNTFENCATSVRDNITNWGWGEAVITITPSHIPDSDCGPYYHKNIRIRDNKFIAFDLPLLYARSVDGLNFTANTLVQSMVYPRTLSQESAISLLGCAGVNISNNEGTGIFKELIVDKKFCK